MSDFACIYLQLASYLLCSGHVVVRWLDCLSVCLTVSFARAVYRAPICRHRVVIIDFMERLTYLALLGTAQAQNEVAAAAWPCRRRYHRGRQLSTISSVIGRLRHGRRWLSAPLCRLIGGLPSYRARPP